MLTEASILTRVRTRASLLNPSIAHSLTMVRLVPFLPSHSIAHPFVNSPTHSTTRPLSSSRPLFLPHTFNLSPTHPHSPHLPQSLAQIITHSSTHPHTHTHPLTHSSTHTHTLAHPLTHSSCYALAHIPMPYPSFLCFHSRSSSMRSPTLPSSSSTSRSGTPLVPSTTRGTWW